MSDMVRDGINLAIRYGSGAWPGTHTELLDHQLVIPTCKHDYFDGRTGPRRPEDLLNENLLHLETAYDPGHTWPVWFREHGVAYSENHRQTRFTDYANLIQALLDGQGIGLVGPPLTQRFYDDGTLVIALDCPPVRLQGFHLAWPSDVPPSRPVCAFMDWIRSEIRQSGIV